MAAPEDWLRQQLLALSKQGGTALDEEMVHGLADYCARANEEDAAEYINNIVGEQAQGIVDVYRAKRRSASGPSSSLGGSTAAATGGGGSDPLQSGNNLQAYIKPSLESGGTKKAGKTARKGRGMEEANVSSGDAESGPRVEGPGASEGLTSLGKVARKKKNKGGQVRVEDVAAGRLLVANRKLCDCQARRHRLITNCLSCGRIVCEQEGEGPCMFCGAMVSLQGGQSLELLPPQNGETDEQLAKKLEAEEKARAFKDRLVEYDRTAAQRTAVIDDQSDFFQMDIEGDSWMSEEEKKKLLAQKALAAHAEREKRSRVQVTFDLVGRKVLLAGGDVNEPGAAVNDASTPPESFASAGPNPLSRIMPNPMLKGPPPIFVDTASKSGKGSASKPGAESFPGSSRGGTPGASTQPPGQKGSLLGVKKGSGQIERVQHDSSYFGAIEPQLLRDLAAGDGGGEVSDAGVGAQQEMSETVRLSGRDIDVEEFGSEPACGTSIQQFGAPVGKSIL